MKDMNELKVSGELYSDPKSGQGKNGTWASAKLKVQGDKYYQIFPISAYGGIDAEALAKMNKGDKVYIDGQFEQVYQKPENKEMPRYQIKVLALHLVTDRGENPEIDDQDINF